MERLNLPCVHAYGLLLPICYEMRIKNVFYILLSSSTMDHIDYSIPNYLKFCFKQESSIV